MTRGSVSPGRRALLAGLTALACAVATQAQAQAAPAPEARTPDVMSLGNTRAPVTVIEYASVGCPHCAVWANQVFPDFRGKFVDTGQVRFEFHEMLTGNPTLAAAGFLTARCAGPDRYFQVVDDVFAAQEDIGREGIEALERIAERAGLTRDRFAACLQDHAALAALSERTQADAKAHGITGTPTFLVGDERLDGEQTLDALDAAITRARAKH